MRASIGLGLLLGLTLSLLMWVSASPAQAETVDECQGQDEIAALEDATEGATFIGQNAEKNRTGLVAKLENASLKLAEGKNADAIQKLTDFKNTVNALNAQGKIAPADAQTLVSGADDAIACITAPETQTPTAA